MIQERIAKGEDINFTSFIIQIHVWDARGSVSDCHSPVESIWGELLYNHCSKQKNYYILYLDESVERV